MGETQFELPETTEAMDILTYLGIREEFDFSVQSIWDFANFIRPYCEFNTLIKPVPRFYVTDGVVCFVAGTRCQLNDLNHLKKHYLVNPYMISQVEDEELMCYRMLYEFFNFCSPYFNLPLLRKVIDDLKLEGMSANCLIPGFTVKEGLIHFKSSDTEESRKRVSELLDLLYTCSDHPVRGEVDYPMFHKYKEYDNVVLLKMLISYPTSWNMRSDEFTDTIERLALAPFPKADAKLKAFNSIFAFWKMRKPSYHEAMQKAMKAFKLDMSNMIDYKVIPKEIVRKSYEPGLALTQDVLWTSSPEVIKEKRELALAQFYERKAGQKSLEEGRMQLKKDLARKRPILPPRKVMSKEEITSKPFDELMGNFFDKKPNEDKEIIAVVNPLPTIPEEKSTSISMSKPLRIKRPMTIPKSCSLMFKEKDSFEVKTTEGTDLDMFSRQRTSAPVKQRLSVVKKPEAVLTEVKVVDLSLPIQPILQKRPIVLMPPKKYLERRSNKIKEMEEQQSSKILETTSEVVEIPLTSAVEVESKKSSFTSAKECSEVSVNQDSDSRSKSPSVKDLKRHFESLIVDENVVESKPAESHEIILTTPETKVDPSFELNEGGEKIDNESAEQESSNKEPTPSMIDASESWAHLFEFQMTPENLLQLQEYEAAQAFAQGTLTHEVIPDAVPFIDPNLFTLENLGSDVITKEDLEGVKETASMTERRFIYQSESGEVDFTEFNYQASLPNYDPELRRKAKEAYDQAWIESRTIGIDHINATYPKAEDPIETKAESEKSFIVKNFNDDDEYETDSQYEAPTGSFDSVISGEYEGYDNDETLKQSLLDLELMNSLLKPQKKPLEEKPIPSARLRTPSLSSRTSRLSSRSSQHGRHASEGDSWLNSSKRKPITVSGTKTATVIVPEGKKLFHGKLISETVYNKIIERLSGKVFSKPNFPNSCYAEALYTILRPYGVRIHDVFEDGQQHEILDYWFKISQEQQLFDFGILSIEYDFCNNCHFKTSMWSYNTIREIHTADQEIIKKHCNFCGTLNSFHYRINDVYYSEFCFWFNKNMMLNAFHEIDHKEEFFVPLGNLIGGIQYEGSGELGHFKVGEPNCAAISHMGGQVPMDFGEYCLSGNTKPLQEIALQTSFEVREVNYQMVSENIKQEVIKLIAEEERRFKPSHKQEVSKLNEKPFKPPPKTKSQKWKARRRSRGSQVSTSSQFSSSEKTASSETSSDIKNQIPAFRNEKPSIHSDLD